MNRRTPGVRSRQLLSHFNAFRFLGDTTMTAFLLRLESSFDHRFIEGDLWQGRPLASFFSQMEPKSLVSQKCLARATSFFSGQGGLRAPPVS